MTFLDFSKYNVGLKGKFVIIKRLESHSEVGTIIHHLNRYFNNPQTKRLSLTFFPSEYLFANLILITHKAQPLSRAAVGWAES